MEEERGRAGTQFASSLYRRRRAMYTPSLVMRRIVGGWLEHERSFNAFLHVLSV